MMIAAIEGLPEFHRGDQLSEVLLPRLTELRWPDGATGIRSDDIIVVASKVVSKVEGRQVKTSREEAIAAETVRVVATAQRGETTTRIVENRQGLVMAAAGVDASNTDPGTVLLLPQDPDRSASRLRAELQERTGQRLGVLITDTAGRPWRSGLMDLAIGSAGVKVLEDLRGQVDSHGTPLTVTVAAVADEIASAVELVTGKTTSHPVAVVRGLAHLVTASDGPGCRSVQRPSEEDLFRLGAAEAYAEGWNAAMAQMEKSGT